MWTNLSISPCNHGLAAAVSGRGSSNEGPPPSEGVLLVGLRRSFVTPSPTSTRLYGHAALRLPCVIPRCTAFRSSNARSPTGFLLSSASGVQQDLHAQKADHHRRRHADRTVCDRCDHGVAARQHRSLSSAACPGDERR